MAAKQSIRMLVLLLLQCLCVSANWQYSDPGRYPDLPVDGPQPNPPYMVDNTHNYHHVAPDKGKQNGPQWPYSGSLQNYLANLHAGKVIRGGDKSNATVHTTIGNSTNGYNNKRQDTTLYWLPNLAPLGGQALAPNGYQFFRNVVSYGADASGDTDSTESINAAVSNGTRCAKECGNDFTQGAIVYFPPGTYRICSPIIQLYYTQFIGDALSPPTIIGCSNFSGIALFDTDPYIPGGNGSEWYVNQNQFFRQIRNFIFDLTEMPIATDDAGQPLVPTGIHWQVAQATSLQNLVFKMPTTSGTTAVGIFTENGSGGFVSDLTFIGGNIGWRAGSQQFTARGLTFTNCLTAIQMVWDWGWTWQGLTITGGGIAFNISGTGGITGQGTGSVSIIDSTISGVPVGILTNGLSTSPNIVLDNVVFTNVQTPVQVDKGKALLTTSGTINLWTTGRVYNGSVGSYVTGPATAPPKAAGLLSKNGALFTRSRPQYESYSQSAFSVATRDGGCKNDGTGDQTNCINAFLQKAVSSTLIAYFPAGIYQVGGTIHIPTNSRIQGSSWSQIQGSGYYFSDMLNPKAVVQVGNRGEVGTMEIVEMLFSVRGNTAGAVLMEWNTAAVTAGAAAMWDSHFRVGGGTGTDLDVANCPKFGFNAQCIAATLMFHVTAQASGYFENIWAWVADHDNDEVMYNNPDASSNQISVYGARGMLIESQGPSWFYGTSSEHSVMYNYQLSGAKNIFMGHIQTETPYYQPNPVAPAPFNVSASFSNDPDFSTCNGDPSCAATWGLRVVDSSSVTIHGAGLYSFFQEYYKDCEDTYNCQQRVLEVTGSTGVVIFNLYTVATSDIAVGVDNTVVFQNASNQRGFTTEDAIWLPIPGEDNIDTIFLGTPIWTSTTATCSAPSCLLVFPTSSLPTPATISPGNYTTSFEYGATSKVTSNGVVTVTFITTTTTTVLSIPTIVVTGMGYSNINITSGQQTIVVSQSVSVPSITISLPNGSGGTTSRVVPLPPWPEIEGGPTQSFTSITTGYTGSSSTYYAGVTSTITVKGPTVTTITFPATLPPTKITCPPDSSFVFATPSITVMTDCSTATTWTVNFDCPTTKVVTFLAATTGFISVDCSLVTQWTASGSSSTSTTSPTTTLLPVWTTWPPGIIIPVSTSVAAPQATNGGTNQPCHLWFFWICISWDNLHVGGWYWSFPPGIYPPGPPPPISWPPGFTLEGTLPPWPRITIGPDNQLTYSSEPESSCKTETASVCSFTTNYLITSHQGTVSTTATSTSSVDCETILGCSVSYSATTVLTSSVAACTSGATAAAKIRLTRSKPTNVPELSDVAGDDSDLFLRERANDYNVVKDPDLKDYDVEDYDEYPDLYSGFQKRAPTCSNQGVIIYLAKPTDASSVLQVTRVLAVAKIPYRRIQSTNLGYVAYLWTEYMSNDAEKQIRADFVNVASYYYYYDFNEKNPPPGPAQFSISSGENAPTIFQREDTHKYQSLSPILSRNESRVEVASPDKTHPWRRAVTSAVSADYWEDALISLPPDLAWKSVKSGSMNAQRQFQYFFDSSQGTGIRVYATAESNLWINHPEFTGKTIVELPSASPFNYQNLVNAILAQHASGVAAVVAGNMLGVCKGCSVAYSGHATASDPTNEPRDFYLEDLLNAWDDMNTSPNTPASSIINISWGAQTNYWASPFIARLYDILKIMDNAGVTIVVAAGNRGITGSPPQKAVNTYPQLFADSTNQFGYLPNMILVGATDQYGYEAPFSQTASFVSTYAPGKNIYIPNNPGPNQYGYESSSGTSYAAPEVAALAAYFKRLTYTSTEYNWGTQLNAPSSAGPAAVKALIAAYSRPITSSFGSGKAVNVVWNGMIQGTNCLLDFPGGGGPQNACPSLTPKIVDYTPTTNCAGIEIPAEAAMFARGNSTIFERQEAGAACSLNPGGSGVTISVTNGPTAGPTCASSCGGTVCSGYWCSPKPTGPPPGYQDPKDPSSGGATASTTTVTGGFGNTTPLTSQKPTTTPATPLTSKKPTTTPSTPTTPLTSTKPTTTPSTPAPSNTFDIYYWICGGLINGFDELTIGPDGGDFCASGGSQFTLNGHTGMLVIATGETFTICGRALEVGTIASNGNFAVQDPKASVPAGTCTSLSLPDTTSSCQWSATSCAVEKKYHCDSVVC